MKSVSHKLLTDFLFSVCQAITEIPDWVIVEDSLDPTVTYVNSEATNLSLHLQLTDRQRTATVDLNFETCVDSDPDLNPDQYRYGITLSFKHRAVEVDRIRGFLRDRLNTNLNLASEWYLNNDVLEIVFWSDVLSTTLRDAINTYTIMARMLDDAFKLHVQYEEDLNKLIDL